MTTRSKSALRALCVLALGLLLALPTACESSDNGDSTDTGGNGGGSDVTTGDTSGPTIVSWKATLQDFQTKANIADGECFLLYNVYYGDDPATPECDPGPEAGQKVPADQMPGGGGSQPMTSGPDGELDLPLPANTFWGFLCDKGDGFKDAYQYNIDANTTEYTGEEIWVISNGLYTLAPSLAGIVLDDTKGVVAGRLVWYDATGAEKYIGCATVELSVPDETAADGWRVVDETESQVRYFGDNDLPTTLENQEKSNPINGLYIGANMPLGPVKVTAKIGDMVIGEDTIFAAAESVVINNVWTGRGLCHVEIKDDAGNPFTANPTPADCR